MGKVTLALHGGQLGFKDGHKVTLALHGGQLGFKDGHKVTLALRGGQLGIKDGHGQGDIGLTWRSAWHQGWT